jgi:hypothetical protein
MLVTLFVCYLIELIKLITRVCLATTMDLPKTILSRLKEISSQTLKHLVKSGEYLSILR